MFDTIHHIAIIGSDYEKSKHFYVDLLGFEIIRENYRKERDDYKIDLACGEQEIELFIIKDAPTRVNYPEALGLRFEILWYVVFSIPLARHSLTIAVHCSQRVLCVILSIT